VSKIHSVVVIGAGQAGLSVSHQLATLGIDHVGLERSRIGETWRGLWDSFCRELDLQSFGVVIFTCGFRPDYARRVQFPAFDTKGFPLTDDGASTVVPGLFFCGVHFLHKRKSSVLLGVGEDAAVVARSISYYRSRHGK
jgi:thioredoxin reductase